jgi:hypothetical protein
LNNGFFPEYYSGNLYPGGPVGESVYFEESHNWVLRQRVDYNNLFEFFDPYGLLPDKEISSIS